MSFKSDYIHFTIKKDLNRVRVMMANDTFNNISVISWPSILLFEETEVPEENHQPVVSH